MKHLIFLSSILIFCVNIFSQTTDWQTYYEKSKFLETPRYNETVEFCKKLDKASDLIKFTTFGISPQGRELPMLIVDKDGFTSPEKIISKGRKIVLIQACIHAGESEGKDAGLMLIRDLVINKMNSEILENVSILFIPVFNVDGHEHFSRFGRINQNGPIEMGWRTTANNLNLNRDFLKSDAIEMKSWLQMFNKWLPDFFIDCHTTDGADYQYVLTYAIESQGNMDTNITNWLNNTFVPKINEEMKHKEIKIFPYVMFRNWHDPRSGLTNHVSPAMLSQGYTALQNRPGLLIETHMLKDYKTRVDATYELIISALKIVGNKQSDLHQLVVDADNYSSSQDFRKNDFPLHFETNMKDSSIVDFLGVDYSTEKSDLTNGTWFKYSKNPKTFQIPYFSHSVPVVSVKLPEAYIFPPEWSMICDRLICHGIKFSRLKETENVKVKSYHFNNIKFDNTSYENRQIVHYECETMEEEREFPAGSIVVKMNQRSARVIAHIFEPQSDDSFLHWGFFNSIFEQKEYSESYVMEEYARKMLENDPKLKQEFEEKKANDKEFAGNWWAILNWFYSKSPYWDKRINSYPVGLIFDEKVVDSLKLE